MKIVNALGWYFPDSLGGTEIYVAALCRRLRAAGHDVAVVAPDPSGERTYAHEGVTVFRYPIPLNPTRDEAQGLSPARGTERLRESARNKTKVQSLHKLYDTWLESLARLRPAQSETDEAYKQRNRRIDNAASTQP